MRHGDEETTEKKEGIPVCSYRGYFSWFDACIHKGMVTRTSKTSKTSEISLFLIVAILCASPIKVKRKRRKEPSTRASEFDAHCKSKSTQPPAARSASAMRFVQNDVLSELENLSDISQRSDHTRCDGNTDCCNITGSPLRQPLIFVTRAKRV
jgi:hypothetical protein